MILLGFFGFCLVAAFMVVLPLLRGGVSELFRPESFRVFFVGCLVPVLAVIIYMSTGTRSEFIPSENLHDESMEQLLDRVEGVLADNPDDTDGWRLLARSYGALGWFGDRERALRQLIRIEGATPDLIADLGETLVALSGNIVTTESKELFEQAVRLDYGSKKARYYLAVATRQEGRTDEARRLFESLLAEIDPDDPWHGLVRFQLDDNSIFADSPGPTSEDVFVASQMNPEDRQAMIEGMVSGLASRLESEPEDLDGWERLIRSYMVLGDRVSATESLKKARIHFADRRDSLDRLSRVAAAHDLVWEEQ